MSVIPRSPKGILIHWKEKTLYYPHGWDALQIYHGFKEVMDDEFNISRSIGDGPYVLELIKLPQIVLNSFDIKIGIYDVVTVEICRVKLDWEFIS